MRQVVCDRCNGVCTGSFAAIELLNKEVVGRPATDAADNLPHRVELCTLCINKLNDFLKDR